MDFRVIFKLLNKDFDKKYAEQYYHGEESPGNEKEIWSTEMRCSKPISEYSVIKSHSYNLDGHFEDGKPFSFTIPNVTLLKGLTENNSSFDVIVSDSLIESTHSVRNEKYDVIRFYFYFKNDAEFYHPEDCIYISKSDYPAELLQ